MARTREGETVSSIISPWEYTREGYLAGTTSGSSLTGLQYRGYSGVNTPNFRKRMNNGELIPYTSWKQWEITSSVQPGSFSASLTHATQSQYNHELNGLGPTCSMPFLTLEEMEAYASDQGTQHLVQTAASRIYARNFDASTFVAELGQVVRMLKGFTFKFVDMVLNRKLRDIPWDKIGDEWLEYRYGWRILYYDMIAIERLVNSIGKGAQDRHTAKAEQQLTLSDSSIYTDGFVDYSGAFSQVDVNDIIEVGLRGSVAADIKLAKARANLVTTGWELLTLSFVIDWILNIGGWLESMSLLAASRKITAAGGISIRITRYVDVSAFPKEDQHERTASAFTSGTYEGLLVVRTPTSVPYTPQFNLQLDSLKVLDLLQIALQKLRK